MDWRTSFVLRLGVRVQVFDVREALKKQGKDGCNRRPISLAVGAKGRYPRTQVQAKVSTDHHDREEGVMYS